MKKIFKTIVKVILGIVVAFGLLTVFLYVSRTSNQKKIDEILTAHSRHPQIKEIDKLSPENISVVRKKLTEENLRGYHVIPNTIRYKGVVITFGGSEGSTNTHLAYYLASHGYEVMEIQYFSGKDQTENVEMIPLELYEEIYAYIKENCKNYDTITIIGSSKGTEFAQLIATHYNTVDNLVLISPLAYVSLNSFLIKIPPWTYKGEAIEYLNGSPNIGIIIKTLFDVAIGKPKDQIGMFNSGIKNSTNKEEARIKIEKSDANILIFYGEDDRCIDAKSAAEMIKEYAKGEVEVYGYENVGHAFGAGYIMKKNNIYMINGGTSDTNIEADLHMKKVLLEKLEQWHK